MTTIHDERWGFYFYNSLHFCNATAENKNMQTVCPMQYYFSIIEKQRISLIRLFISAHVMHMFFYGLVLGNFNNPGPVTMITSDTIYMLYIFLNIFLILVQTSM